MELVMGMLFVILAISSFVAYFFFRESDIEDAAMIILTFSVIFFFVGGASFLSTTMSHVYAVANETGVFTGIVTENSYQYAPIGWLFIALSFIPLMMLLGEAFSLVDKDE